MEFEIISTVVTGSQEEGQTEISCGCGSENLYR